MDGKNLCIVLGGSFNPPTRAHRLLMEAAMAATGAVHGVYVPSSDFYVGRKVDRSSYARLLSESDRAKMLGTKIMACDGRAKVSTCEFGDRTKGRTLKTLDEIQAENPGLEPVFVMGCDKMHVFQRWPTAETILRKYRILWVGRGKTDFDETVAISSLLSKYKDRMLRMNPPAGVEDVSSSLFWKLFSAGDDKAFDLLEDTVADLVRDAVGHGQK